MRRCGRLQPLHSEESVLLWLADIRAAEEASPPRLLEIEIAAANDSINRQLQKFMKIQKDEEVHEDGTVTSVLYELLKAWCLGVLLGLVFTVMRWRGGLTLLLVTYILALLASGFTCDTWLSYA